MCTIRQSFEVSKLGVVGLGGNPEQLLAVKTNPEMRTLRSDVWPRRKSRKAGDPYSRHIDFINMFFRTQIEVIRFVITSSFDVTS
jgi:hypothetical protein